MSSDSPSTTDASSTVVSGSAVETIDAVVDPTRRSPAKNSPMAATVETTAIAASQPSPGAVTASGCRSPTTSPATVSDTAAPVQTNALSTIGPARREIPSELRM